MIPAHPRHLELAPGWSVDQLMAKARAKRKGGAGKAPAWSKPAWSKPAKLKQQGPARQGRGGWRR